MYSSASFRILSKGKLYTSMSFYSPDKLFQESQDKEKFFHNILKQNYISDLDLTLRKYFPSYFNFFQIIKSYSVKYKIETVCMVQ